MIEPSMPENEADRLSSLLKLRILDTPAEERYDRITRLAQRLFHADIALVSLIDRERQWFKSAQGLEAPETSRCISFCGHAIHSDEPMVIRNALEDERFCDNPLVTGEPNIRFYAGQPIATPDGNRIGTLCIIDRAPKELSPADLGSLRDLGQLVENELTVQRMDALQQALISELDQTRRQAMIDPLTRLWNRGAIFDLLGRELERAAREKNPLAIVMGDLDHFKSVNDTYGHAGGDAVLRSAAESLRGSTRPYDCLGRYGGEEFLLLLVDCNRDTAQPVCECIRSNIESMAVVSGSHTINVTMSMGVAIYEGKGPGNLESLQTVLLNAADQALYRAKDNGRNQVVMAEPQ